MQKVRQETPAEGLARRVRARREAIRLSQSQLAQACGMSQQGIDSIERAVVERPRKLPEIARALQTTQDWLLFEVGNEIERPIDPFKEIGVRLREIGSDKIGAVLQYVRTLQDAEPKTEPEPKRKRA